MIKSALKIQESVININLLSSAECQRVSSKVHKLKQSWIAQKSEVPFYSLGSGSYFHAVSGKLLDNDYYTLLKKYNPLLQKEFGWLYQRLADILSRQLNAPTCYSDNLALPGFHIFLFHPAFEQPIAKLHRDLQYRQHQWQENQENNHHISFTLALKLPKFGGGMNIWDLHHHEVDKLSQPEIESLALSRKKEFYPYQLGTFALHSGHFIHQIAPAQNMQPDDQRITLQGHGTCDRGVWHLYW
jgi:hypothetical protein